MPEPRILRPKFLTKEVAEQAINSAARMASNMSSVKDGAFSVVVLVPIMLVSGSAIYPDYPIQPRVIAQISFGEEPWKYDFREIARCKALQLWQNRNTGGTDIMPHLLFPNDTPFWGGVKRDGIVVACSGVQPWFDRMIAGITADTCIALAYDAWMKSPDKADGELCFLT